MKSFSFSAGIAAVLLAITALYLGITKLNSPQSMAAIPTTHIAEDPGIRANPKNTVMTSVNIPQHEVKQQVQVLPK